MRTGAHVPDAAPGAGDSEIMTCHKNWAAYDESLRKRGRSSSPHSSITLTSLCLRKRSFRYGRTPLLEWTVGRGWTTSVPLSAISRTSTFVFIEERIGPCRQGEYSYP